MPSSEEWYSIAYINNKYIAVAKNYDYAATSDNGFIWHQHPLPNTFSLGGGTHIWTSIAYGMASPTPNAISPVSPVSPVPPNKYPYPFVLKSC